MASTAIRSHIASNGECNDSGLSLRGARADNLPMSTVRGCQLILSTVLMVFIAGYAYSQTPKGKSTEVSQSEYEIFSSFIAHSFGGKDVTERVGFPVSQIIIVDRTEYDESEVEEDLPWKKMRKLLRKQVPSLQLATIESFREANLRQSALQQRFDLPLPYQLVAESTLHSILHDVGDWPKYYKQYPGAQGILTFSRVGFSQDGAQGLFYVSNGCGGLCATDSFVVAQRRNTKWTVLKEVIVRVS